LRPVLAVHGRTVLVGETAVGRPGFSWTNGTEEKRSPA
jgi:hypothetical protein